MDNSRLKPDQVRIPDIGERSYENRKFALLDCIRKFPGHTENWYADVMTLNHICARKTSLEIIRELESDGQINDNKVGNSFHSYSINHDDDYIAFNEMLNEYHLIEEQFLSYEDKISNIIYNDVDLKQKLGNDTWDEFETHQHDQITILKAMAVDAVGLLLRIYSEMMHKYDHIGDVRTLRDLLRIIDLVSAYDKKGCLSRFDHGLYNLKMHTEKEPFGTLLNEKGVLCEELISRLIKFEGDISRKFVNNETEQINHQTHDLTERGQKQLDDFTTTDSK